MGSSSSSHKPRKIITSFPSDPSIKSLSVGSYNDDTERYQSSMNAQTREINKLREENLRLLNEVAILKKKLDHLSLSIDVSTPQYESQNDNSHNVNDIAALAVDLHGNHSDRNLPSIGDHVVAMWGQNKWQYFTATIQNFDQNTLKYTIEWDDHDPTGRVVDYYNLAIDKVPTADQIGVGSKVLFHQGKYKQQEVHGIERSGGLRWHQGEIESIYKNNSGKILYDGHHTKGLEDGKWVTYKDYDHKFTAYSIEDFRMPPNVFDILSSIDSGQPAKRGKNTASIQPEIRDDDSLLDVYVSYAKINCSSAIANGEFDQPPSYSEAILETMVDPRNIVNGLEKMGIRVFTMENETDQSLLEIVGALKRVKVFIACLSDEYASNDKCRMEFQYAKKTLKLPVIPLVVGSGSFEWQMTVVGMLIAGELYIHFKNKEVEVYKMTELARSIKSKIPDIKIKDVSYQATGGATMELHTDPGVSVTGKPVINGPAEIFFSYCWYNSHNALGQRQIPRCEGGEQTDPRMLMRRISEELGMTAWIDVERLESAAEGMGMFDQIATALNNCKLVVACISQEYAESDNCRMEIQFAAKSLKKPVVCVVVGKGDGWKGTVVGMLVEDFPTINIQSVQSDDQLQEKIKEISIEIKKLIGTSQQSVTSQNNNLASDEVPNEISVGCQFRAPTIGDHVICLHQRFAYFMATVAAFNREDMTYIVDWDDKDPSGRVQSYKDVALDVIPNDEIGVGSVVLFPQGSYGGTQGNNDGGVRYHQGIVTGVTDDQGTKRFSGKHTKGESDGKWVTFKAYHPTFEGLRKEELRLSSNAMDVLMASNL